MIDFWYLVIYNYEFWKDDNNNSDNKNPTYRNKLQLNKIWMYLDNLDKLELQM